ncbi:MAG: hypothetical protein WAO55_00490 [Candidatus Manganitrophaceae bacterium]
MLVSAAVLLLASLGFIVNEWVTFRGTLVQSISTQAAAQLDAKGQRYVDIIMNSSVRMGSLIDDLLVFS